MKLPIEIGGYFANEVRTLGPQNTRSPVRRSAGPHSADYPWPVEGVECVLCKMSTVNFTEVIFGKLHFWHFHRQFACIRCFVNHFHRLSFCNATLWSPESARGAERICYAYVFKM